MKSKASTKSSTAYRIHVFARIQ